MKYLTKFETNAAYITWTASENYITPNVSIIDRVVDPIYNKYVYDYSKDYLTIVSLQDNNTIGWRASSSNLLKTISVSTDNGTTWTTKESSTAGTTLAILNNGDKILVKGSNTAYDNSSNSFNYFTSTANFNVEGNIMSLLYGDNFANQITLDSIGYNFYSLFIGCSKLISAENLILPATTLTQYCYYQIFFYCGALTIAPELPATILADSCYQSMFNNCTSLMTAPTILPATTLAQSCYVYMFKGCTSLMTAPELPATTLIQYCYGGMFQDCSLLTTAPELPAITLANGCYEYMFKGCTSLNYIKCLATNISASGCTQNWVDGVASTGTFTKAASMTSWTTGDNGIPTDWTVQDAA